MGKERSCSPLPSLHEKYPNMEFFLVGTSPYSVQVQEDTDQKNTNQYLDTFRAVPKVPAQSQQFRAVMKS